MLDFVFAANFPFCFSCGFGEGFVHLIKMYTVVDLGVREVASRGLAYIFYQAYYSLVQSGQTGGSCSIFYCCLPFICYL